MFYHSPGKDIVTMAEVDAAIQEMFQAPHVQVSWRSIIYPQITIFGCLSVSYLSTSKEDD